MTGMLKQISVQELLSDICPTSRHGKHTANGCCKYTFLTPSHMTLLTKGQIFTRNKYEASNHVQDASILMRCLFQDDWMGRCYLCRPELALRNSRVTKGCFNPRLHDRRHGPYVGLTSMDWHNFADFLEQSCRLQLHTSLSSCLPSAHLAWEVAPRHPLLPLLTPHNFSLCN